MKFLRAKTVDQALLLLEQSQWQLLAGGTDFYPALREQTVTGHVLDISALTEELRLIELRDGYWRIGALTTWSDIIKAELPPAFEALKLAAREVGSVQIQSRATIAGNLANASPAADGVPPLLVLDAVVELKSRMGTRLINLADFVLGNRKTARRDDELLSGILIPESSAQGRSSFLKLGARKYLIISISMVAVRLDCDANNDVSCVALSVGSCSLVAQRLKKLEKTLLGEPINSDLSQRVTSNSMYELAPIDDIRACADYRHHAALQLIKRSILTCAEEFSTWK
jgi:CO/xanthine dehydrogenase FAD-binding subunit